MEPTKGNGLWARLERRGRSEWVGLGGAVGVQTQGAPTQGAPTLWVLVGGAGEQRQAGSHVLTEG